MTDPDDFLALDDAALLTQCDVHIHRSSGPGGQHRNKVSSAVRLLHRPTGITATATESRSQHDNRRAALRRLRMNLACRCRRAVDRIDPDVPPVVAECIFTPRGARSAAAASRKLAVGRKDARFWPVAAFLLDLLDAAEARLAPAAAALNISTSNLTAVLKSDRHLFAAAQAIRKTHDKKPIT